MHALKRKRRSRKLQRTAPVEEKFLPLTKGARQSVSDSIVAAYSGDSLASKQEAGEDFWVDPQQLEDEVATRRAAERRKKQYARKKDVYKTDKLKEEITSPYKNNVITYIVLGVGVAAALFAAFPGLLENAGNVGGSQFPDTL